jgi:hypothetical protein
MKMRFHAFRLAALTFLAFVPMAALSRGVISPPPDPMDKINVRTLGAFGDGVRDDTAAIQNALKQGRKIYLPHGVYAISTPLLLGADQTLFGDGIGATTIKWINPTPPPGMTSMITSPLGLKPLPPHICVRDLTVDGNRHTMPTNCAQNAVNLIATRSTICRVQAIRCGGVKGGAEGFTLGIGTQSPEDSEENLIDSCIVEQIIGGNETAISVGVNNQPDYVHAGSTSPSPTRASGTLRDCMVKGANIGYGTASGGRVLVENCMSDQCNMGWNSDTNGADELTFKNCQFRRCASVGILIQGAFLPEGKRFKDITIQGGVINLSDQYNNSGICIIAPPQRTSRSVRIRDVTFERAGTRTKSLGFLVLRSIEFLGVTGNKFRTSGVPAFFKPSKPGDRLHIGKKASSGNRYLNGATPSGLEDN